MLFLIDFHFLLHYFIVNLDVFLFDIWYSGVNILP